MSRQKIIHHYLERTFNKEFEIDMIRKELEASNVPEEEIRIIVRAVDDQLLKRAVAESQNRKARDLARVGLSIAGVGFFITAASYLAIIDTGSSYLIVYGPFFAGMAIFLVGYSRYRPPKGLNILVRILSIFVTQYGVGTDYRGFQDHHDRMESLREKRGGRWRRR